MPRDRSAEIEAKIETLEVIYFDEDPDGEPGRTGHGYYFRFGEADSWDGAYGSVGEATDEARDGVERRFEAMNARLETYSSAPSDGKRRFMASFIPAGALDDVRLFSWLRADGTAVTLVDASDIEAAKRFVRNVFYAEPIQIEEHPFTVDEFCADGIYEHPDPATPSATPFPRQ